MNFYNSQLNYNYYNKYNWPGQVWATRTPSKHPTQRAARRKDGQGACTCSIVPVGTGWYPGN